MADIPTRKEVEATIKSYQEYDPDDLTAEDAEIYRLSQALLAAWDALQKHCDHESSSPY